MSSDRPSPEQGVPFFGDFYRRTTEPFLAESVTRAEAELIARVLGLGQSDRTLDLGCGSGRHLRLLAGRCAAVGVDSDRGALASARRFAPAVAGDLRDLPFADRAFDKAWSWYSTPFVFDEAGNRDVMAEAARVLKPGGRLVLQTVNPRRLEEEPRAQRSLALPDGSRVDEESAFDAGQGVDRGIRRLFMPDGRVLLSRWAIRYYSLPEIAGLLGEVGLKVVEALGGTSGEPFSPSALDLIVLASKEDCHGG